MKAVSLLDINVLLALAWPTHVHHAAAHRWFSDSASLAWASCPLTQLGFVRLSIQSAVVKVPVLFGDVMDVLERMTAHSGHRFWALDDGLVGVREEMRARVAGHQQLTDAVLLDLAIRHEGWLATFDRRVDDLLPPDSAEREAVAIIPVDG